MEHGEDEQTGRDGRGRREDGQQEGLQVPGRDANACRRADSCLSGARSIREQEAQVIKLKISDKSLLTIGPPAALLTAAPVAWPDKSSVKRTS